MENFTLPAATYQGPRRQVRLKLNTIIEDDFAIRTDSSEDGRGRSRSPSSRSDPPSSPIPSSASTISSYYRKSRLSRDFDDLYDVSESESERDSIEIPEITVKRASGDSECSLKRSSWDTRRRNRYPSLEIPSPRLWPTIEKLRKELAVPPTPPAKIPISPEVLSKLNTNASLPSAPPSLDGSLSSDQIALSSAPSTPREFSHPENIKEWSQLQATALITGEEDLRSNDVVIELPTTDIQRNSGVRLPDDALNILQHLSPELDFEPPSAAPSDNQEEMQEVPFKLQRTPSMDFEPKSAVSEYSIAELSVPSPGGFFSSLNEDTQQAWFNLSVTPPTDADGAPSSTTAEHFYNAPWHSDQSMVVEQVVSLSESNTEGPQTAVFVPFSPAAAAQLEGNRLTNFSSTDLSNAVEPHGIETLEILDKELSISTAAVFDRTTDWLVAQDSYMSALDETDSTNGSRDSSQSSGMKSSRSDSFESGIKRAVRFLETDIAKAAEASADSSPTKTDSLFYHAFQYMSNSSSPTDSFVHRQCRFDAIQAQRTSFQDSHVDSLLGHYETFSTSRPNPLRPISMMPGKSRSGKGETPEQRLISRVERERQALEQVAPAMWAVEALRFLSGGRLFNSPVANVLSSARPLETSTLPDHVRVLDLGGQPQCDWAWHCALDFPNVKTYTATPTPINETIRGPSNHRLCPVDNLWTLPFPANHFDAVSARSLPTFLRTGKPLGNDTDEYDLCLRECMRVLKPGGYLEFFILDAEIVRGSKESSSGDGTSAIIPTTAPLADAASVEFGFKLRQQGYDPVPAKSFLARIRRAGYVDIKRAWMFLPMGTPQTENLLPMPETPPPHASLYEDQIMNQQIEAVQGPVGSKSDVASVSGLLGGWLWEQWLLKLQLEMGKQRGPKLLEGVASVVEEGKRSGAGWRVLKGWARKGF